MTQAPSSRTSADVGWGAYVPPSEDVYAPLRERKFAPDSTLILLDARHAAYRAINTRELSAPDGTPTSALHGIIEIVMAACSAANTTRFLLVWDGGVAYKRAIHPAYKIRHDRDRTPEEQAKHERDQHAIRVAVEGLHALNFPSIRHPDLEADDLMGMASAAIARGIEEGRNKSGLERVLLVTDDKDHLQLLRPAVHVWRGVTGELATVESFRAKYNITPEQYVDYKALLGEPATGDNIPGVRGIGDVTAGKMIATHGSLEAAIAFCQDRVAKGRPAPLKVEVSLATKADDARLSYRLSRITTYNKHLAEWGIDPDQVKAIVKCGYAAAMGDRPTMAYADIVEFMAKYGFTSATIDPPVFCRALGFTLVSKRLAP